MVALAGARGVHERGAVRGQRRGHEDKDHEEEEREVIVFLWFIHYIKSLCWEVSGVEPFEQSEIWKELLAHESEICRLKRSERVLYTILGAIAGAVIVLVIRTA